ncbi:MAG: SIR2 family protein, partial [Planctomycetota bacterium]
VDKAQPNASHKAIARLARVGRVRAIFTTNFDTYLERALQAEGVEYTRCVTDEEFESYYKAGMPGVGLLKLHGSVDVPDAIVYTASQYVHGAGFSEYESRMLTTYLHENPVVFLGFSGWDFDHDSYRDFWAAAASSTRRILWNVRPGDTTGPQVTTLLKNMDDRLQFISGELPNVLVDAARILTLDVSDLEAPLPAEAETQKEAGKKRRAFWAEWAAKLPPPSLVGLCITDALMFSSQYQRFMAANDPKNMDLSASFNVVDQIQALTQKLMSGEISQDAYMAAQQELTMTALFSTLKPELREQMIAAARAEKPRLGHDVAAYQQFISFLSTFARYAEDPAAAVQRARSYTEKFQKLIASPTRESGYMIQLLTMEAAMAGLPKDDFARARNEMLNLVRQVVGEEIDDTKFSTELTATMQKWSKKQTGMPDYEQLLAALVREASAYADTDRAAAVEAVTSTLIHAAGMIGSHIAQAPAYQQLALASAQGDEVDPALMDQLEAVLSDALKPLFGKLPRGEQAWAEWARFDLASVAVLASLLQWTGSAATGEYMEAWKTGAYPRRAAHPVVGEYLKNRFLPVWEQLDKLPARYHQLACSYGAIIAEMTDDIELCRACVDRALKAAGGQVSMLVREPVPEALAAMHERRGEMRNAALWYGRALEGFNNSVPRVFGDALVYRAFRTHMACGDKEAALSLALKYSPQYTPSYSWTKMSCRDTLTKEVEVLSRSLGYANAEAARRAMKLD